MRRVLAQMCTSDAQLLHRKAGTKEQPWVHQHDLHFVSVLEFYLHRVSPHCTISPAAWSRGLGCRTAAQVRMCCVKVRENSWTCFATASTESYHSMSVWECSKTWLPHSLLLLVYAACWQTRVGSPGWLWWSALYPHTARSKRQQKRSQTVCGGGRDCFIQKDINQKTLKMSPSALCNSQTCRAAACLPVLECLSNSALKIADNM